MSTASTAPTLAPHLALYLNRFVGHMHYFSGGTDQLFPDHSERRSPPLLHRNALLYLTAAAALAQKEQYGKAFVRLLAGLANYFSAITFPKLERLRAIEAFAENHRRSLGHHALLETFEGTPRSHLGDAFFLFADLVSSNATAPRRGAPLHPMTIPISHELLLAIVTSPAVAHL